eukprot:g76871.t1
MQTTIPTGTWQDLPIAQLIQKMQRAPDLTTHQDPDTIRELATVLATISESMPTMMTGQIYQQCEPPTPLAKGTPQTQHTHLIPISGRSAHKCYPIQTNGRPPTDFLNIEVNRISYDGTRRDNSTEGQSVNNNLLLVDLDRLDLSAYFSPVFTKNREAIYEPISLLLPLGETVNNWHWITAVKDPHHGWRIHDDSHCYIFDQWRDQGATAHFITPKQVKDIPIYTAITAILYERVDREANRPTIHYVPSPPPCPVFFLPTIPRLNGIPEGYTQWIRGPPIALRAPDTPDVVTRTPTNTQTESLNSPTRDFWKKISDRILKDIQVLETNRATVSFSTRSHTLAQAPDSNRIMGYDFAGKSLRPVHVPALTQTLWDLIRSKTLIPSRHSPNPPGETRRRLSISFRVFTTWAEIPPPFRSKVAHNDNLRQSLRTWEQEKGDSNPRPDIVLWAILDSIYDHIEGISELVLEYLDLSAPANVRILTVTQTDTIDEGKALRPPWHPRTIALIQHDKEVTRGLHSTVIFQEIVKSTRFKKSSRHHFCVLLYRPEVPNYEDLSTSLCVPPDSKFAAPTTMLLNQTKILQQVIIHNRDGDFWGPESRSAAQKAGNLLFHRIQIQEDQAGTFPQYRLEPFKGARKGWYLLLDPQ